ncbi:hypothetical protein BC939DRAFT_435573 [Gamsiella multidivaricata]|uniref:uncharacterized protein n=1 Tax=Gamsiella multidivaricata TaxID=101098 RepID=UPI00221E7387|nr:uncharacterized protein BC939DRAFT_435573 [Gamsiella multidivaricata]KAI7832465.1 hypothetical protein BC939DRAFT_435573 [Gamsiella multidivaricata]
MLTTKTPVAAIQKQETDERPRRQSTIQNPHLAFDPTIPAVERAALEGNRSAKSTLERRSNLQQQLAKVNAQADDHEVNDNGDVDDDALKEAVRRMTMIDRQGSSKGPAVRKRLSLHQDLFNPEQAPNPDDRNENVQPKPQQQQQQQRQEADQQDDEPPRPQQNDDPMGRRASTRPLSANILPESLTSVNNHAMHQESARIERARRLSEEEDGTSTAAGRASLKLPETQSLGRATGTRYGRSGSSSSTASGTMQSPTTPTTTNPYGTLSGRTPRQQGSSQRHSLTGLSSVLYTKPSLPTEDPQQPLESQSPVQLPALSKLQQSPTTTTATLSRSESRASPSLRRPGYGSQEMEFQKQPAAVTNSPSPVDRDDEEFYRTPEREEHQYQQQTPRASAVYTRQQAAVDRDRETPEWNDDEDRPQPLRYQPQQQQQQPRTLREPGLVRKSSSSELQKEQHNLQRLRIQQQAREEVYGRGYGNGYADEVEFADEYQGRFGSGGGGSAGSRQRNSQISPTRDFFTPNTTPTNATVARPGSGHFRASPPISAPVPMPLPMSMVMPVSAGSATPSRYSDHYRRQSKDGHSLMPPPKISPPLTATTTTTGRIVATPAGTFNAGPARRSFSAIPGSNGSRRLSTSANVGIPSSSSSVGYGSALPSAIGAGYGAGGVNGSMHGRSASSGSAVGGYVGGQHQRMSMYSTNSVTTGIPATAGMTASERRAMSISDGSMSGIVPASPRRSLTTMGGGIGGNSIYNKRGSGSSISGSFAPPPSSGGLSRGSASSSSSSSPEYARVFAPPRGGVNAVGASNNSSSSNGGHLGYGGPGIRTSQQQQHLQDHDAYNSYGYNTRSDASIRQSLLVPGGIVPLGHRNSGSSSTGSITPRGSFSGASSSVSSASHLRRATSVHVNGAPSVGGGGGTGSLGRSSGMMAHRQHYQQQQQQPLQQQQQQGHGGGGVGGGGQYQSPYHQYQQPPPQHQQYQRTSMYAYH